MRVRVKGNRRARLRVHEGLEAVVQGHLAQLLRLAGGEAAQALVRAGVEAVKLGEVDVVGARHLRLDGVEALER